MSDAVDVQEDAAPSYQERTTILPPPTTPAAFLGGDGGNDDDMPAAPPPAMDTSPADRPARRNPLIALGHRLCGFVR